MNKINLKGSRIMKGIKIIVIDETANSWREAIAISGNALSKKGYVKENFSEACAERELIYPTGIPSEVPIAIPHTTGNMVNENSICVLRLKSPVGFYRMDDPKETVSVRLVINMALQKAEEQLSMMKNLMNLIVDKEFADKCLTSDSSDVEKYLMERI